MIKIDNVFISAFGKLKNFSFSLGDGFNSVCQDNGFGKTTIAIFIKAMFFGFGKTKTSRLGENERKRYTPWESNEKFGGYLCFSVCEKKYKVERNFGKTASGDTFALYDEHDMPCFDYDENIGKQLFDIDADSFERCIYLPQKEVTISANDTFLSKLNKLVDNTDDTNNFESAKQKLQDFERKLVSTSRSKNVSERMKVLDEIQKTQGLLFDIQQCNQVAQIKKQEIEKNNLVLDEKSKQLASLKKQQKDSDQKHALLGKAELLLRLEANCSQAKMKLDEMSAKNPDVSDKYIADLEYKIDEVEKQKQKIASLSSAGQKQDIAGTTKTSFVLFGFAAISALLAIILSSNILFAVLFGVVAVCAIAGAVVCMSKQKTKARAISDEQERIRQDVLKQTQLLQNMQNNLAHIFASHKIFEPNFYVCINQLKNNKNIYDDLAKSYHSAQAELFEKKKDPEYALAVSGVNIERADFSKEIKQMEDMVFLLAGKNAGLQKEIEILLEKAGNASELKNRLDRLEEELSCIDKKAKLVEMAINCLDVAKTNLSKSFVPKIREQFQRYISFITNGQYDNVSVDDRFELRLEEKNSYRDFDYFSKGIMDIGTFCLRLALIDTMYQDNLPFLILDDPFVNYDDGKKQMALRLVGERAKKCQIIYFSCHKA